MISVLNEITIILTIVVTALVIVAVLDTIRQINQTNKQEKWLKYLVSNGLWQDDKGFVYHLDDREGKLNERRKNEE